MSQTPYLFQQLCLFLPRQHFDYLVKKYDGNRYVKSYTCWNHLLTMVWAQLTGRLSLRDIVCSLQAHRSKLYRLGMGTSVCRSTISEANASREVGIYRGMAQEMMRRTACIGVVCPELEEIFGGLSVAGLFAVDSSTVHLPLAMFPWSVPQRNGGGIKIHTMFDILRNIPVTCLVTGSEERDQAFMDGYTYAPSCMYLFDKAYVKTAGLFSINRTGAFFVVRLKAGMRYTVVGADPEANMKDCRVLADERIAFTGRWAKKGYPEELRLVSCYCPEKNRALMFLTNNFDLPAWLVAYAYRNRWAIERFFKWVKQHLHITAFYGRSPNAVFIQIYTAVIAYCLTAKFADEYKIQCSNYELSRALGMSLTEKISAAEWAADFERRVDDAEIKTALPSLFD